MCTGWDLQWEYMKYLLSRRNRTCGLLVVLCESILRCRLGRIGSWHAKCLKPSLIWVRGRFTLDPVCPHKKLPYGTNVNLKVVVLLIRVLPNFLIPLSNLTFHLNFIKLKLSLGLTPAISGLLCRLFSIRYETGLTNLKYPMPPFYQMHSRIRTLHCRLNSKSSMYPWIRFNHSTYNRSLRDRASWADYPEGHELRVSS